MSRSMEAKEKLLEIIETRIRMLDASEDGLLHRLSKELDMPPNECAQQLLLLVSALVPKAFSSILTTLIRHLSLRPSWEVEDHLDDEAWLASAIQEAHRLEPPFIAMRRVVTKAGGIRLGNYRIPQDTVVMIMLPTVNRDGTIYSDPDSFDPTRFLHDTATPPLTFGYGARRRSGCCQLHTPVTADWPLPQYLLGACVLCGSFLQHASARASSKR
eukprot:TRINITY_DN7641_c0_g1_i2.p1 TRINITY_DN7641_c0_g1~~TRINITY_DN7641_c0_g1_i2.p1  ORF type:complete len:215 (+),score=25.05 TRINITY_DN7641_c0_g1_i2:206-850(+)